MFCTTQLQNSPLPAPARQEGLLRVAEGDCQLHRIRGLVWTRRPGAGARAFCLSAGGVHPALGREPLIPPPHPLPECCLKFDCSCLKIKKKKKCRPASCGMWVETDVCLTDGADAEQRNAFVSVVSLQ